MAEVWEIQKLNIFNLDKLISELSKQRRLCEFSIFPFEASFMNILKVCLDIIGEVSTIS